MNSARPEGEAEGSSAALPAPAPDCNDLEMACMQSCRRANQPVSPPAEPAPGFRPDKCSHNANVHTTQSPQMMHQPVSWQDCFRAMALTAKFPYQTIPLSLSRRCMPPSEDSPQWPPCCARCSGLR
eukprot:356194-Chlamydomonas_euryale.AAC.4